MLGRFRVLVIVLVLSGLQSGVANAQSFCNLTGTEFLERLRGPWTVSHLPGISVIPVLGVTGYPPPGVQVPDGTMIIDEVLPDFRAAIATGLQDEEMFVWNESTFDADFVRGIGEASPSSPDGCAIGNGPVLAGVNFIEFTEAPMTADSDDYLFCVGEVMAVTTLLYQAAMQTGKVELSKEAPRHFSDSIKMCAKELAREGAMFDGGIWMYLTATFSSPSAGAGVLFFEGEQQGYAFSAMTPIRLSR